MLNQIEADFDIAFGRLMNADMHDKGEVRRALRDVFANFYPWRDCVSSPDSRTYRISAEASFEGRTTEALSILRNIDQHHLEQIVQPKALMLFPSDRLFPSEYLFPGENLTFLPVADMVAPPDRLLVDRNLDLYHECLGGLAVLPALDASRSFLKQF